MNDKHVAMLHKGRQKWNRWRMQHPDIVPDLRGAILNRESFSGYDFSRADFYDAELENVDFTGANFGKAICTRADFIEADLQGANMSDMLCHGATFSGAKLNGTNLQRADLSYSSFHFASLCGADLTGANLQFVQLIRTDLKDAILTGCLVFGISVWNVELDNSEQSNLIITDLEFDEPFITVDNLEVAQFIYLLLNNEKIRSVIDTLVSKAVLILGRFTPERQVVLERIRQELRSRNYLPILFDFEKPMNRDVTETVRTLAHLSRFIIADLTDPRSLPQELQAIVPDLAVPVQPLLHVSQRAYGMFDDFRKYPWVLPIYYYADTTSLLASLGTGVIAPAEQKARDLGSR